MCTPDFFRYRLDQMIDMRHRLVVLASRIPWAQVETALAPALAHKHRQVRVVQDADLFGPTTQLAGSGVVSAGRPRLPVRLMVALLYLKHAFNESDQSLVQRWLENPYWQFFSGLEYFETHLPCDHTQIGRFRNLNGEAGVEELLKATIETAVRIKAIKPAPLEPVIVDTTVQEKAIAHPVDSRLLEIASAKVVQAAKAVGIELKQTYAKQGKTLRRQAGGHAHARPYRRLKPAVKRQRTILGVLLREVRRKLPATTSQNPPAHARLNTVLERAERIDSQQRTDKNKLYALHAPEVECIGKGKARKPYEFSVKASIAVSHQSGLIVGARTFAGNAYDGHTLAEQLEQTGILLQDIGVKPQTAVVDLTYQGQEAACAGAELIHRDKLKSLTQVQRRWLKRRQAIEPVTGHLKADHRMDRCWLRGAVDDALHAVLCATGLNIGWLLRAIVRGGIKAVFLRLQMLLGCLRMVLDRSAGLATAL
jgi:IS5 family transposase